MGENVGKEVEHITEVLKANGYPAHIIRSAQKPRKREEYIGETKRALGTRIKKHQSATRKGEIEKSTIAERAWTEQHHPIWDQTAVIEQAKNVDILRIKEAFCISLAERKIC